MNVFNIPSVIWKRVNNKVYGLLGKDPLTKEKIYQVKTERIGTNYGGWVIPANYLTKDSVCYCAGVGEDVSFDLGIIKKYVCKVYAFDPTPRAQEYIEKNVEPDPNFVFVDVGLWDEDTTMKFYSPKNPDHVSHSIVNLQKTDTYFEAKVKRLSTIMRELQHDKLSLLKLDIEGAEYKVLDSLVDDKVDIDILCIEFDEGHTKMDNDYKSRIKGSLEKLFAMGYVMIDVDQSCNYTLIKENMLRELA
ncbi:MAG: FkbM family methyltransferase [bacterium]|nr:FkbM family methyltransferase [bacterium]